MQNPEPDNQPTGWDKWKPHQSVVGGNSVGAAVAVLLVPFILPLYPKGVDHDSITVAFSALCTFLACYLIPDGSRQ
jgi:hypothetical protein